MSLRKPPKSTPRRSAASRENGKQSHSAAGQGECRSERRLSVDSRLRGNDTLRQGRVNVGLNALRHGSYCSVSAPPFRDTLMAPGGAPEQFQRLNHQFLAPYEPAVAGEDTRATGRISSNFKLEEQTWNFIENKGSEKLEPGMFMKTNEIVELT